MNLHGSGEWEGGSGYRGEGKTRSRIGETRLLMLFIFRERGRERKDEIPTRRESHGKMTESIFAMKSDPPQ